MQGYQERFKNSRTRRIFRIFLRVWRAIIQLCFKLFSRRPWRKKKTVLGRLACVGLEVLRRRFNVLGIEYSLLNFQKGRVDIFNDVICASRTNHIGFTISEMKRQDVWPLIEQQTKKLSKFLIRNADFVVIDSYSDLTDQLFLSHDRKSAFCSHYSDLKHSEDFRRRYRSLGLLDISRIEILYRNLFSYIRSLNKNCQIVYLHYSAKYDSRPQFHERSAELRRVLRLLEDEFGVLNLDLDDSCYEPNENDDYPYHYAFGTYEKLKNLWLELEKVE